MPMSGYTKLFNSILASTIWREDDKTRIVWITLLAMANRDGIAEGSIPGLADFARVSIADCEAALEKLKSPDKFSRSKDNDGRRIAEIDGGWQILNHAKYRAKMSNDERRVYFAGKQREYRERKKGMADVKSVKDSERQVKEVTHTKAEAKAEASSKGDLDLPPVSSGSSTVEKFSTVDRSRHNAEAEAEADSIGDLDLRDRQLADLKAAYVAEFPEILVDMEKYDKAFRKALRGVNFADLMEALPIVAKRVKNGPWANTYSPAAVLDPKWFWNEAEVAQGQQSSD